MTSRNRAEDENVNMPHLDSYNRAEHRSDCRMMSLIGTSSSFSSSVKTLPSVDLFASSFTTLPSVDCSILDSMANISVAEVDTTTTNNNKADQVGSISSGSFGSGSSRKTIGTMRTSISTTGTMRTSISTTGTMMTSIKTMDMSVKTMGTIGFSNKTMGTIGTSNKTMGTMETIVDMNNSHIGIHDFDGVADDNSGAPHPKKNGDSANKLISMRQTFATQKQDFFVGNPSSNHNDDDDDHNDNYEPVKNMDKLFTIPSDNHISMSTDISSIKHSSNNNTNEDWLSKLSFMSTGASFNNHNNHNNNNNPHEIVLNGDSNHCRSGITINDIDHPQPRQEREQQIIMDNRQNNNSINKRNSNHKCNHHPNDNNNPSDIVLDCFRDDRISNDHSFLRSDIAINDIYPAIPSPPQLSRQEGPQQECNNNKKNNSHQHKRNDINHDATNGREYVEKETVNDILLGRGSKSNTHPGNIRYREYIEGQKHYYHSLQKKKLEKTKCTISVVQYIQEYGGRFLKFDDKVHQYYVLSDTKKIREKVAQALREENTHESRLAKREKYHDKSQHQKKKSEKAAAAVAVAAPSPQPQVVVATQQEKQQEFLLMF